MDAFRILDNPPDGAPVDEAWFDTIAALLLGQVALVAGGKAHRLVEIEFYYSGGAHPDPFAHCDPIQQQNGTWYFHRDEGSYRGGSFKGLDVTFGLGAFGGVLIRTIRADEDGKVVNGCSLCVDHLLSQTGHASVAELDGEINGRNIWDAASPLHLRLDAAPPENTWKTARVGLTLKRAYKHREMKRYIMRPYRYLTDARAVKKGRLHHIIGLHKAGQTPAEIRALTGSPARSIQKYIDNYTEGLAIDSLGRWYGKSLKNDDLCRIHGAFHALYEG